MPAAGQVQLLGVLVEHPGRRELPEGRGDRPPHALHPATRHARRRRGRRTRARSPTRGSGTGPSRPPSPGRASSPSGSRPPMAQPLSPAKPSSHQPSSTDRFTTPFAAAFMPDVPGCLERPARVVEPDVDARDEEAPDAHVVVLEDEHAAPELGRSRAAEDLLDDAPGPAGPRDAPCRRRRAGPAAPGRTAGGRAARCR